MRPNPALREMYVSKTGRVRTIISKIKFYRCREFPLKVYLKCWRGPKKLYAGLGAQGFYNLNESKMKKLCLFSELFLSPICVLD